MDKAYISIVEKRFFKHRVCKDHERLGEYLYDFIISILKSSGTEVSHTPRESDHTGLFCYVDSTHKLRIFEVSQELHDALRKYAWHSLKKELDEYASHHLSEGKNILFALNRDDLSMKEFEDNY